MEYQEYLQSAEWAAVKFLVRGRSGGWCEWCRARGRRRHAVNVHHLTYKNLYNEAEHLEDVVHLCRWHHLRAHGRHEARLPGVIVALILLWWLPY